MPAWPLTTRCRAKINLTLRVLGRRSDGYHELESLVAFAGVGDMLTLEPGLDLGLSLSGPFGDGLAADPDNLVLKAASAIAVEFGNLRWGRFRLVKRLPIASGIGGGSADAAGALRLLARLNGIVESEPALLRVAAKIGADVPVCLASRARIMSGLGETLGPLLAFPPLFSVLVNPGVPVATAGVFRALGLAPGDAFATARMPARFPAKTRIASLVEARNDLQPAARDIAPLIGDVLDELARQPGCRPARMSGSGATCFGLFDDCRTSAAAAKAMTRNRPDWWVKPTLLR